MKTSLNHFAMYHTALQTESVCENLLVGKRKIPIDNLHMAQPEVLCPGGLFIFGCSEYPLADGETACYYDAGTGIVILLNLPDGFDLAELPLRLERIQGLEIRLTDLTALDLSGMTELRRLNIAYNRKLSRLTGLSRMQKLQVMTAEYLPSFPELFESEFPLSLELLTLAHTPIRWIPESIRGLKHLTKLDLSGLELAELPVWLPELGLEFRREGQTGIVLHDTIISGVDMSLFDMPREMIVQWFEERGAADLLVTRSEVKVVFLGDGGVGKSLIAARLAHPEMNPGDFIGDTTSGVTILDKVYAVDGKQVLIHFWDFGGQEILHSLHHLFLTQNALYVVVLDARSGSLVEQASTWLRTVSAFAPGAPVLLAVNKIDQNPSVSFDLRELRELGESVRELMHLSALHYNGEQFSKKFIEPMLQQIGWMDELSFRIPASWDMVRKKLLYNSRPYITINDYRDICLDCDIDLEMHDSLLRWLCNHSGYTTYLGRTGGGFVFLRPQWLVDAIYAILSEGREIAENGSLSHKQLMKLLKKSPNRWNDQPYSAAEVILILNLLRSFKMSFRFNDEEEFIPMLCTNVASSLAAEYEDDPDVLEFRMTFEYLPEVLLHTLMVRRRIELDKENVWRTGARFLQAGTGLSAVVRARGNVLNIFVQSTESIHMANHYLSILQESIREIAAGLVLPPPFCEVIYKGDGFTEAFDYDDLLTALSDGETTYRSKTLHRSIAINDILYQGIYGAEFARDQLLKDIQAFCSSIQEAVVGWGSSVTQQMRSQSRTGFLHTHLRDRNYCVSEMSASDNNPDILPLLDIRRRATTPWTMCASVTLAGSGEAELERWSLLTRTLLQQATAGMPFLFLVTFLECTANDFSRESDKFHSWLRHAEFSGCMPMTERVWMTETPLYETVRTTQCTYDCGGSPLTVFHILVHIPVDGAVEAKKAALRELPTNEYKVVFLGDGEAGKSLTVARLKNPELDPKTFDGEVTPGVHIVSKPYEIDGRTVQVNFWDFGGQEVLHSMHRLFLSEQTLYVVLLNTRNDNQDERARFWLRYVRTYAPDAPVMLVLNKIDQNPNASLNRPVLQQINSNLKMILSISALTWDQKKFREEFVNKLDEQIRSTLVQGTPFTTSAIRIRDRLRAEKAPRISIETFYNLCCEEGIRTRSICDALLRQFHGAGVCVHFSKSTRTDGHMLLKPEWITNAIYTILFNFHSTKTNGIVSRTDIFSLFDGTREDVKRVSDTKYSREEVSYVLEVMHFFRLSFEIPERDEVFLPMLCPRDESSVVEQYQDALEFQLCFDYLPADVLYRLMVARRGELNLEHVWLTGARFCGNNRESAIVMREGSTLKFLVRSNQTIEGARRYMDSLYDEVEKIIRDMNVTITENRMAYRADGKTEYFDYKRLKIGKDLGALTVISTAHEKLIPIQDVLNQTFYSEQTYRENLLQNVLGACKKLQRNKDNWSKDENGRNRYLCDVLDTPEYIVLNQPEYGASATWKGSGRPDIVVRSADGSDDVIIEALNLQNAGSKDVERWEEHLSRLMDNYNTGGYRLLILISYVTCSSRDFHGLCDWYDGHMRVFVPSSYDSPPDSPHPCKLRGCPEMIRVFRADYYRGGYSPAVFHMMIHIPSKTDQPSAKV